MILPFQRRSYVESAVATLPGLVACWPLNDGVGSALAKDYLGVNNGTISATGVTRGAAGPLGWDRQNGAMGFDGSTGKITITDSPQIDIAGSQMSVTCWLYPTRTIETMCVASKWQGPDDQYTLVINSGKIRFRIKTSELGGGDADTTLALNQWQFVAVTYDGSKILSYYNGTKEETEYSLTGNINSNDLPLELGYLSGGKYWKGNMSTVALYNRALTAPEVQGLYLAGIHGV